MLNTNHQLQDMRRNTRPGDCWSVRSANGIAGPAALLLEPVNENEWLAAPLFAEGQEAGETDVCLEPAPEWLYGENWCALGNPVKLATTRLYAQLGSLPPPLINSLLAARHGEPNSLKRGPVILKKLGDPRAAFHDELEKQLRICGQMPAMARASIILRLVKHQAQTTWEAVCNEVRDAVDIVLTPTAPLLAPVMRSNTKEDASAAWNMQLTGIGPIAIEVHGTTDACKLEVRGNGIRNAEFRRSDSQTFEPCECLNDTWLAGDLDPIGPGSCLFRLQDKHHEWLELEIHLPLHNEQEQHII